MRAAVYHGVRDLRVEEVDEPGLEAPGDVVVAVTYAAVCGSDLHPYRGRFGAPQSGRRPGHEFVGVVEEVGEEVQTLRRGDVVLAPFAVSCGQCPHCRRDEYTSCYRGGFFGSSRLPGGQAEAVRVPHAEATLWKVPAGLREDELLPSVLLLGDVAGTGEHAARLAEVRSGDRVVIVGDGAVGLCATIAAARRRPEHLVLVGHHEDRMALARELGADTTLDGRDVHVADEILEVLGGMADAVLETVGGGPDPLGLALALVRDYGTIGAVGVFGPEVLLPVAEVFERNLRFAAGVAPTRAYIEELAELLAAGEIDPSPVLTHELPLGSTDEAYRLMDQRDAVKVLLTAGV